jgi:TonB family protein
VNLRAFFYVVLLISFSPLRLWAQTDQLQDKLNSAYMGKTLLLRNFYSGDTLAYGSDGQLLSPSIQLPWTLSSVEITGIVVAAPEIEIRGNRMGTVFEGGRLRFIKIGKLRIHLERDPSNKDSEAAIRQVFVDPQEDLRPLLPDYWQSYLSGNDSKSRSAAWTSSIEKSDPTAIPPAKVSRGAVSAPSVIQSPDPKYTKEAASRHFEGTSVLMVVLNTKGSAENIAILRPLGMGLDEQAVKAVQQWRFQPAIKNGQPVRALINIEILFRCCP